MRQPKRQKQQEKLEDLIRDLERDLSEGKSQVAALEETYKRLEESERLCQELADENRRLVAEITVWQERCARSEESERQLSTMQRQLETLQAEHARATERNRELEQTRVANTQPFVASNAPATAFIRNTAAHAMRATQVLQAWVRENRRVAVGGAGALVLLLMAVVTIQRSESDRQDRAPTPFPEPLAAVAGAPDAAARPATKAVPRIRGIFQTVRPTRVYSEPSEDSDLVADLGKGTRVNVVDSQNGWLEIHSKHGRRPGFIRRDAVQRVASN